MNLYIRADADSKIGTGHIMRCIALAQAWQDRGGKVTFLSHCESDALRQRIIDGGFDFITIEKPHPDSYDLNHTLEILKQLKTQNSKLKTWFVLDGYHFTPDYQKSIRDAGIHLLVIDDMNHLPHYHADILLNQNIHAPDLKYHCDEDATLLLGTRYVLLRREFLKYRGFKRQIPERVKNILVTLGGGDPDNVTLKVIQALNLIGNPSIEAKIVVGLANQNIERLQKELALSPCPAFGRIKACTFQLSPDVSNMPELMAWADLAISAGGSTCWELAFMGLPNVVIVLAENQRLIAEGIDRVGIALNIGWHDRASDDGIAKCIEKIMEDREMRVAMSIRGHELVGGEGRRSVISEMNGR